VYELMGERRGGDGEEIHMRVEGYETAFVAYQGRRWGEAEGKLLEVLGRFGQDGPAEALLARVRDFRDKPPPADWDGVYISSTK